MEQIYTIPINEAFEASAKEEKCICPFCKIYNKFEENEIDLILGASMMEPDVRIKTNKLGFCKEHYRQMLAAGKKLPVALILETHLEEISKDVRKIKLLPALSAKKSASAVEKKSSTCYVCGRIDYNFERVLDNAVEMWLSDGDFRKLFVMQKGFCLPHYSAIIKSAKGAMKSSDFSLFSDKIMNIEEKYLSKIKENVSFFAKKFDYRYENEPWGDAKEAVEDAISALCGHEST